MVVMVVVSDKNSVSQSAVQFVATENKNVICYHGSTIEKIDDPNFHKAHDAYFAFQVEYSDFLLNTSPDKKAMYGVKHDKFRDLHSAFDNENSEILKDPELAKYMFARALDDYNRSKKMVVTDVQIRKTGLVTKSIVKVRTELVWIIYYGVYCQAVKAN